MALNPQELNDTDLLADGNLQAYYRFEGDFLDETTNSFDGSGSTSPTSVPSGGQFGGAYDWNGTTDNVSATFTAKTPFSTAWSANAWIEPDSLGEGAGGDYGIIWSFGGKSNLKFDSESGSNMKIQFNQGFDGAGSFKWVTDNYDIPKNTWSMVTVVYDGSSASNNPLIYVNGAVVDNTESATSSGTVETSVTLNIGNNANSGIRAYNGVIDDLSFFDRSLTATEISNLYDLPVSSSMLLMF